MSNETRVLFCNCTYAQVVPKGTKEGVLKKLCESDVSFDAVADLCEMSARNDPSLKRLAEEGPLKIVACFPRAVKWLFSAGDAPLNRETSQVINMRTDTIDEASAALFAEGVAPNLPEDNRPPVEGSEPDKEA
jgi:hypothetical protein